MPYMTNGKRDYKKEVAKYTSKPEVKKKRAAQNAARRAMMRAGKAHKGDGKELDHVGYHRTGSLDNVPTRVVSRAANRRRQPPRR